MAAAAAAAKEATAAAVTARLVSEAQVRALTLLLQLPACRGLTLGQRGGGVDPAWADFLAADEPEAAVVEAD